MYGYDGVFVGDEFNIPDDLAILPQVSEAFIRNGLIIDVLAIQTQYVETDCLFIVRKKVYPYFFIDLVDEIDVKVKKYSGYAEGE